MDTILQIIQAGGIMEVVFYAIGSIVVAVLGVLAKRYASENASFTMLLEAVFAGVKQTYEEYVKDIKKASKDGKLTDEEKAAARHKAMEYAYAYAKSRGVDLLERYGPQYLEHMVEWAVHKMKASSKLAKFAPYVEGLVAPFGGSSSGPGPDLD